MKRFHLYALTTAILLVSAPATFAADAPAAGAMPVAVVNIQEIMRESTAAKTVHEQLESKQKTFQSEITKKEEQLQKENQDLGKQQSVLSKAAFEEKARTFRNKATDVQKEVQSKKALLDSAFERALAEIQKSVTDIIGDIAKEKGFVVALPTSQTLYFDNKLDISQEVLTKLNQKLPKLDVKFDSETKKPADAAPAAKTDDGKAQ